MKRTRNGFIKNLHYLCLMGVVALGLMTIVATGGGGGATPTTCTNVAGTWSTTEVVDGTACGSGIHTEYITYTVTQDGCNITVVPSTDGSFSGTVNGNQISWTVSFPKDGGTTTANVSFTISGDNVTGSASWTWSDGTDTCSGTTQISGTRTDTDSEPDTASIDLITGDLTSAALRLYGSPDRAVIGYDDSIRITSDLTIEVWVKVDEFQSNSFGPWSPGTAENAYPIISQGNQTSAAGNYTLGISPSYVIFAFAGIDSRFMTPGPTPEKVWTHIAVVHTFGEGDNTQVYVNGEIVQQGSWVDDNGNSIDGNDSGFPHPETSYYIGIYGGGDVWPQHETETYYFRGLIEELRIWNTRRTQTEIQTNLYNELNGSEEGLAAYWNFNEVTGSNTIEDISGNGNSATLENNAEIMLADSPVQP